MLTITLLGINKSYFEYVCINWMITLRQSRIAALLYFIFLKLKCLALSKQIDTFLERNEDAISFRTCERSTYQHVCCFFFFNTPTYFISHYACFYLKWIKIKNKREIRVSKMMKSNSQILKCKCFFTNDRFRKCHMNKIDVECKKYTFYNLIWITFCIYKIAWFMHILSFSAQFSRVV